MKGKFDLEKHIKKHKDRIAGIRKEIREHTRSKHIKEKRDMRIPEEK